MLIGLLKKMSTPEMMELLTKLTDLPANINLENAKPIGPLGIVGAVSNPEVKAGIGVAMEMVKGPGQDKITTWPRPRKPRGNYGPRKILIIDDDPEIISYLKDVFEEAGYETEGAKNGIEGLEKAQVHKPDLITLDMDMPARGGTLFYVKLRQEPSLAEIPVIVISGVGPPPAPFSPRTCRC